MNTERSRRATPGFVKLVAAGIVVGLCLVLIGAWQIAHIRNQEEQRDCERAAASREDNRAMWIWLGEQFPEGAVELGLDAQLDMRLPLLRCDGGNPVPRSEES